MTFGITIPGDAERTCERKNRTIGYVEPNSTGCDSLQAGVMLVKTHASLEIVGEYQPTAKRIAIQWLAQFFGLITLTNE
ncbi:MAG: hypothetical protein IPG22_05745 [Acidobacteria bacterium]|nr:hypothetical protein [Acidobacteriota bacterium]